MDSDAKRSAILDRLADHVLAHGLAASSLRPLAAAAATSDRMLLYYFRDKADLMAAVLTRVADRSAVALAAAASPEPRPRAAVTAELFGLMTGADMWPYVRLWLEVAALAAKGDALCARIGEAIGRGYLAWGRDRLAAPEAERDTEAARLLVAVEGMVFLHSLGLGDVALASLGDGESVWQVAAELTAAFSAPEAAYEVLTADTIIRRNPRP